MHKQLAILTSALLASTGATAEPLKTRGAYLGAAYGLTHYEDDGLVSDSFSDDGGAVSASANLDEESQGFQLYGGYRFSRYLALEGRYTHFGDYGADFNDTIDVIGFDPISVSASLNAEFSSLTVNALGIIPFGNSGFDAYGQLGLGAMAYETKFSLTVDGFGQASGSNEDTAMTYSLGAGLRYTPPRLEALTVNLAYDIYFFQMDIEFKEGLVEYSDTVNQSLSMFKLAAQYNF